MAPRLAVNKSRSHQREAVVIHGQPTFDDCAFVKLFAKIGDLDEGLRRAHYRIVVKHSTVRPLLGAPS